jgi:hypothetical protein
MRKKIIILLLVSSFLFPVQQAFAHVIPVEVTNSYTYSVDTDSIYEKDKTHFNVIGYYTIDNQSIPILYEFKYTHKKWQLKTIRNNKRKFSKVEKDSIAEDVLLVCRPYLQKAYH